MRLSGEADQRSLQVSAALCLEESPCGRFFGFKAPTRYKIREFTRHLEEGIGHKFRSFDGFGKMLSWTCGILALRESPCLLWAQVTLPSSGPLTTTVLPRGFLPARRIRLLRWHLSLSPAPEVRLLLQRPALPTSSGSLLLLFHFPGNLLARLFKWLIPLHLGLLGHLVYRRINAPSFFLLLFSL